MVPKPLSIGAHTGVPQGSKLSPPLFFFYIADMPTPTEPVKRVCYTDGLTVWVTEVKIQFHKVAFFQKHFNINTADMPPPRAPVHGMTYANDITSTHTSKHECSQEIHATIYI